MLKNVQAVCGIKPRIRISERCSGGGAGRTKASRWDAGRKRRAVVKGLCKWSIAAGFFGLLGLAPGERLGPYVAAMGISLLLLVCGAGLLSLIERWEAEE